MSQLSSFERAVFNRLRKEYPGSVISPGKLRLETTIKNNTGNMLVPVLEDSLQPLPTETRLNKNDVFFMTGLGVCISRREIGKEGISVLQTYPNEVVFVPTATMITKHLNAIYNGNISLKVGNQEFIEILDTNRFLEIPQTQKSAAGNFSQKSEESTFEELPIHYILRGTDQIKLAVNAPIFTGIQWESDDVLFTNQLVLLPKGFIIKGGAGLKPVKVEHHQRHSHL
jgi:hypothetical protein